METQEKTMQKEIDVLIEAIKQDYLDWNAGRAVAACASFSVTNDEIRRKFISDFNDGIETSKGSKYIKITTASGSQRSVWGFVVLTDNDKKFRKGDILKAAGWAAPARNFSRGNILDGGYTIRWTGTQ